MAVLRRRYELAEALLAAGFPVALSNARKWAPVDEAIALNDKRMVCLRSPSMRLWPCDPGSHASDGHSANILTRVKCAAAALCAVHARPRAPPADLKFDVSTVLWHCLL